MGEMVKGGCDVQRQEGKGLDWRMGERAACT